MVTLKKIPIPPGIILYPLSTKNMFIKIDNRNVQILIYNQFVNIYDILEMASWNLSCSTREYVEAIVKSLASKYNNNALEKFTVEFLLNSIIYYNASYDYILPAIYYIYTPHDEVVKKFPIKTVNKKMQKLKLTTNWDLALCFLVNDYLKKNKNMESCLASNASIPDDIKHQVKVLKDENKTLRNAFKANQLKHRAIPSFIHSDKSNMMGTRNFIDLSQFYNIDGGFRMDIGKQYDNPLNIDKTRDFLIKYHNTTVDLLDLILKDILVTDNQR